MEALNSRFSPLLFRSHWSKVKVKLLVFVQISFDSSAWKLPNLVQWMPIESRKYWFSDYMVKSQDQTVGLWKDVVLLLLDTVVFNFEQWLHLESRWPHWFSGHVDVVKGQGQTADLHPKYCLLTILWAFNLYWSYTVYKLWIKVKLLKCSILKIVANFVFKPSRLDSH